MTDSGSFWPGRLLAAARGLVLGEPSAHLDPRTASERLPKCLSGGPNRACC
jgi:hypothetical protein